LTERFLDKKASASTNVQRRIRAARSARKANECVSRCVYIIYVARWSNA
jgi:hypothetical protein